MQAIILAAGMGKRLGKLTKNNTKCMIELNGKTLIKHALEKLDDVGIRKVILVVGYKKENLISHVGNSYKRIRIEYIENPIYYKTNNIYSLYLAKEKLAEDDTLLLESDIIFEEAILRKVLSDPRESLAVVDKFSSWMDGTCLILDKEDRILDLIPKASFNFQNIDNYYKTVNIYKFSKKFSVNTYIPFLEAYIKTMGNNEYYESVIKLLTGLERQELRALRLTGEKWYEIDDVHDLFNAQILFAKNSEQKLVLIQKRYGGYWRFPRLKDFCYLVNPYFPNQKLLQEIKANLSELISRYPSGLAMQNALAAKVFGVEQENIVVGNGASELIKELAKVIAGKFGIIFPTFNEYAERIGYERIIQYIPNNPDLKYSIDDLISLSDSDKVDNILLINPDNPSGNFIDIKEIIKLAEKLKIDNKILILDESFIDFSLKGETLIKQEIINNYDNLIIVKSISKSYGVPGLRLGVLVSSNIDILKAIKKEISIWNINSFAEYFMQIIDKYKRDYLLACKQLAEERERFYKELSKVPFLRVIPSEANYFLCEVKGFTATELTELLLEKYNIFIKDLTGKIGLKNSQYIRISIRNSYDNNYLVEKLKELI